MKYATVRTDGTTRGAVVEGDELVLVDHLDAAAAAAAGATATGGTRIALADADLASPSVAPPKIICVGLNYASHILEMGQQLPKHPTLFAKFTRAMIGPYDDIVLPKVSEQADWEGELAAVITREARHVTPEQARDAIGGYTILNDVSIRDFQKRTLQWLSGKTFERSTPVGPFLVTPDEVDHAADLEVRVQVDDEVMQVGRTSDLVFDAAHTVSIISEIITLEPGDIIATGTPGGVGMARDPEVYLRDGQVVRTSIEGIGELVNTCVRER